MAIRCSYPNNIFRRGQTRRIMMTDSLIYNHQISPKTSVPFSQFCMVNNKVYEDQVMGIVCYRDERGEIICEGYDEGPRCSHHSSSRIGERIHEGYKRPRYNRLIADINCEEHDDDQLQGIICYRDRTGEIICEGYDEGPRYDEVELRREEKLISINQL